MIRNGLWAATAAVCLFSFGCGEGEGAGGGGEQPTNPTSAPAMAALTQDDVAAVWPQTNTKVFSTFDLLVGLPGSAVDGRIAVIKGTAPALGDAVAAGEGVWMLPAKANCGELTLPVGKHDLAIQVLDADGKSMGPDWSTQVTYDVVANPDGGRKVMFKTPADGAKVGTKFKVEFGLQGMGLSPAGENSADHTLGHHHVIVNGGPMMPGMQVPSDPTHLHYGRAQTEAEIELLPGTYELTMQFADAAHRSYGPRMASTIKVTVE